MIRRALKVLASTGSDSSFVTAHSSVGAIGG